MSHQINEHSPSQDARMQEQANEWFLALKDSPHDIQLLAKFNRWIELDDAHEQSYLEVLLVWQALDDVGFDNDAPLESASVDVTNTPHSTRGYSLNNISLLKRSGLLLTCVLLIFVLLPNHLWQSADYATATAQQAVIQLDDGSQLHLNAQSAVNVRFDQDSRVIELLYGEAFFEVAKDASRPFRVSAGGVQATAVGTAFNIRLLNGNVQTTLTEGVLDVVISESENESSTLLRAGQRLELHRDGHVQLVNGHYAYRPNWKRGVIRLDDMSLEDVVDLLNRHYRTTFRLIDPRLSDQPVRGVIPTNDLETVLVVMASSLQLEHMKATDQLILLYK